MRIRIATSVAVAAALALTKPKPPEELACEHGDDECACGPDNRAGCLWAYPAQRREERA